MQRIIFCCILIFILLFAFADAKENHVQKAKKQSRQAPQEQTVTISKKQYDEMLQKMNLLQNRLESLERDMLTVKKEKEASSALTSPVSTPAAPGSETAVPAINADASQQTPSSSVSEPVSSTTPDDQKILEELQKEMDTGDTSNQPSSSVTGNISANPDISVIGDIVWNINHNKKIEGGSPINLREIEFAFQSNIDPWSRADIFAALHNEGGSYHLHLEEAYLTYNRLPWGMQMKAGKFFLPFGKDNTLHQHARPYVDIPNVVNNFLGPEGQAGTGAQLSAVVPVGKVYTELTGAVVNDEGSRSFTAGGSGKPLYAGHIKAYADLNDSSNIELGYSRLQGFNNIDATRLTRINGLDLTYRWRPLMQGNYNSFLLRGEYLWSRRTNPDRIVNTNGYYGFAQWQMNRNWYLGARYDYSQFPNLVNCHERAYSGILTYFPTEFAYYRLQYKKTDRNYAPGYNQLLFQINFMIGPHGAHLF